MWFNILKAELFPEEEDVIDIELNRDALADSCCSQAKMDFMQTARRLLHTQTQERIHQVRERMQRLDEGPRKQEIRRLLDRAIRNQQMMSDLLDTYDHLIDTGTCADVRRMLNEISTESDDPMQEESIRILEEWEECENGLV
tara:strand:- start:100 stop:525 length:426 start_codon:yes stop_codon:yes gene_type:complete